MKARLLVYFVAFTWLVLAWTAHSLDVVVDLPQDIRHDVDEFILLTVFGAGRDISLELLVFSNDVTFYRQEIIRQFENDQNTFQIPFKIAPTFENCHQPSPVNSDLLCPVILSIEIKEGETSIWRNKTEANLLKTPGKIFIQTNKPIYFPGDEVLVRFLALDYELLSVRRDAHLSIQSPEIGGSRMIAWEKKIAFRKQPYVRKILLPEDALVGSWKICASYTRNTVADAREESFFTVSYATTPSFKSTIQYEGRDFILPGDDTFALRITARTVFGEPINGIAFVSFGLVRSDNEDFLKFTHIVKNLKLVNGEYFLAVDLNHLMGDEDWTTLPAMRLVILSSVTEYGSGETQTIRDDSVIFSIEPYIITYMDGEDSFQPGIIVIANVKLTYPNGTAVQHVEVDIRFTSMSGAQEEVMFYQSTSETCSLGTVTQRAESPAGVQAMEIISTSKYRGQNGVEYTVTKTKVLRAQDGTNAEYVHIIAPQEVLHIHSSSVIQVYAAPSYVLKQIHYSVTKKGRLIMNRSTTMAVGENDVLIELPISPSMSPYVIFTAYYFAQDSHQLVSDRAVIYVEQSCSGEKPAIFTTSDGNVQPVTVVNFEVTGEPSSLISITGFDAALKSLSPKFNQDVSEIISRQSLSSTSLLCDNGRIFTGTFVQNSAKDCVSGGIRTKRSITDQSIDESVVSTALQFKGALFECCIVGARDISSVINSARSCEDRLKFVVEASCRQTFLRCCKLTECLQRFGNDTDFCRLNFEQGDISSRTVSTTFMPFTPAMKTMFLLEKNIEFQRKDFSSTWFFIDFKMGASGRKFLDASSTPKIPAIPDSITKWNINIFITSPDTPLCFGNEVQIPIQHYVYTKVRLPKTAVIIGTLVAAEVTTYNHLGTSVETYLHLSGEEGLCGGNHFGENTEPIRHTLQPSRNSVPSSNTIFFSMLPLRAGDLKIKIKLLWHRQGDLRENSDEVVETLKVIPAGTRKREVKWILVDTRHPGFAIRQKITREKALPISNDATPDAVELKASVHSTISALLAPPDLSSIDPTSINYQLYRLNSNLLRLKYLERGTTTGPKATDNILEEIQDSYLSLLGYVRPARRSSEIPQRFAFSYSPARMSQPSLKLTSSVVSLLYRIAEKINVDMTLLRGSLYWILDQQKRQGYFYEASEVLASEDGRNGVKVKISRKRSVVMPITESKIYLTGNILTNLAIIKTMVKTDSLLRKGASDADLAVIERAISMGQSYLKKRTRKVASASRCRSTIALTAAAHALQLTEKRVDASILAAIRRWKAEGSSDAGEIWWIQSCVPDFFEPRTDQYEADADTIEATARMLSVEILLGYTPDRYVNWLISKRNAGNYWTSLQASLVAMDSLGRYALLNQGRESMAIDIEIEDSIFGNYSLKYPSKDVPLSSVKSRVRYHTTGEGRAWIKIVSSYHYSVIDDQRTNKVDKRDRSARSETSFCIYSVDIAMTEDTPRGVEERSAQPRLAWKMSISVRIRQDVIGDQYQSYVLDVKLPAGSNVIESDLSKLFNPVEHVLDHYRITSRSVLFYMTGNKSISFRITHTFIQRDPIPLKIYPVSVPELACWKFYNFPGLPATVQTFCARRNVSSSDVCVCANGNACPQYYRPKHSTRITLEKRIERTCETDSTFAYKVFLQKKKVVDSFWLKYEGQIISVYRSTGFEDIQTDIDHSFWIKRSCNKISLRRNYLIIGKTVLASNDGRYKHLMDKNSWVEFWPQNPDDCGETTSKLCISSRKLDEYEYTIRRSPCGLS